MRRFFMALLKNRQGSVLLMVAAIMAFITIITVNIMHNVTLVQDIALERIEQERQTRAIEALMKYAICCVNEIQPTIKEESGQVKTLTYTLPHWPTPDSLYEGVVDITYNSLEQCFIRTTLKKGGGILKDSSKHIAFVRKKSENTAEGDLPPQSGKKVIN